jgi:RNA polymerase sigma factor (sigma-70 family)
VSGDADAWSPRSLELAGCTGEIRDLGGLDRVLYMGRRLEIEPMSQSSVERVASKPSAPDAGTGSRDISDQHLLARFVTRRDEGAFALLVQRHGGTVLGVCRRILGQHQDAEDAFQAVFIVLARKAASIRKSEAVGSWLYGVAYRIAMKQRKNAARRHEREQHAGSATPEEAPLAAASFRELQALLDELVERLPQKYRAPFVLCCLEGLSKSEAARELGWKEGTVSSRVFHARKLLEKRLARRGVTLAAVLTACAVGSHSAAAASAAVAHATARGALAPAAECLASGVSPQAEALAEYYLALMARTRWTAGALGAGLAALLMCLLLTGLHYAWQDNPVPESALEPDTFVPPPSHLGTAHDEQVVTIAFAPGGRELVTAGGREEMPGQLKIWDVASGRERIGLSHLSGVQVVAFAPDGFSMVTGDRGGAIRWRDPETAQERASFQAHLGAVRGLAFAPDGTMLASGGADQTVRLWDAQDEARLRHTLTGHTDQVHAVAFFDDGQSLVSASRDRTARIWDVAEGKEQRVLTGHRAAIEAVAVAPGSKLVATAARDGLKLWDAATGLEEPALAQGDAGYVAVAFAPDGKLLAAAAVDGTVVLWDTATRARIFELASHRAVVWCLAFSPDGARLASGSADKTAKIWHVRGGKEPQTLITCWSQTRPISALAYAPGGDALAVATGDHSMHLRETVKGDVLRVMPGHADAITCLAYTPDGRTLASGSKDSTIHLWDPDTAKRTATLPGHPGGVLALAYMRDGQTLISGGADRTIRLWDGPDGAPRMLSGHQTPVMSLAVGADGQRLASGAADGTIKVWDLTTSTEIVALEAHAGAVRALAFGPGGVLASAGDDAKVKVWEADGAVRHTLQGHAGAALTLAFAPGGRALVSGGRDGLVVVWDPHTGVLRGTLQRHSDAVTALAIHPLGRHLISGSLDTSLLRWQAAKDEAAPANEVR